MKQYIKDNEIKYASDIIVIKDSIQIINPSEKDILNDGWIIYQEPKPTEEELLEQAKLEKINELMEYDRSINVNEFSYNNISMWLSREERIILKDRFEREIQNNIKESHIYYNNLEIILSPIDGLELINLVCDYADASFDVTLKHIYNVNRLTSISEIEQYNYKADYPSKLNLL